MKQLQFSFVCVILASLSFAASPHIPGKEAKMKLATNFFSAKDQLSTRSNSNIKLKNTGNSTKLVYGLYVRQYAYVAAGQPCSSATVMYSATENKSAGAVPMQVSIDANAEANIGSNYLYNLLYGANYFIQITIPVSPPGCQLPGCTWGADTTIYNWCIYLGAMAPVSVTASYTAKVAPATDSVSGVGFDYNLVSNYNYIGPISCDDQALTCSVATAQTQSF